MRADVFLLQSGNAATRSQAQRLIASGVEWRPPCGSPWRRVAKNGDEIPADAELRLLDGAESRYVSRGGIKLEAALHTAGPCVAQRHCLDVGQGTGGFTDCLLQQGAAQVLGVDVGHGQLHARLRGDARVLCIEGLNARALTASALRQACAATRQAMPATEAFDIVTGDLSFISLTLVLPALAPLLAADGDLLMLVKPQFELQPGQIGKGGIVRDAALYAVVENRIRGCCADLGLVVRDWIDSPIRGGDGNREFFVYARRNA
ncbi:TlyA family RNA methyltransferase [Verminephrobacter aporrectodeae subsp. tuberculatae]|uniref:TlyA family RNA methyltransferase n=1 Tax=Verminephrobacter aporrectodeae TaxID=1110389 RepID=UPI0022430435|nr:TlyA family RNA methyltransferase [Verminephrobacter aporrectodeae]MCW8165510.1 TlyA family RNA methyltransferase [Verminephrobacter aporrectodeae subsp. tuberculatae]MCW8170947.1 TlyA family RNA methyltransferase [Verminephrobacter aporrectodeae subsp. tuberculatae]MCW8207438.1 TlyA family RNA methyltransferase [Verminephrobacter aporrectodeae subsp. tuberculatae]